MNPFLASTILPVDLSEHESPFLRNVTIETNCYGKRGWFLCYERVPMGGMFNVEFGKTGASYPDVKFSLSGFSKLDTIRRQHQLIKYVEDVRKNPKREGSSKRW